LSGPLAGGRVPEGGAVDAATAVAGVESAAPVSADHRATTGIGMLSVLASASTLVCCTIPAILVLLGAGSVLAGLVSGFPGVVWLSENKLLVFGFATVMMTVAGVAQRAADRLPCPADAALAAACATNRRRGRWLFRVSAGLLVVGATFAFLLPALA
jgi:hypothetical protein